ncbi:MAG: nuclear transport factor 2 family protein [Pseudomonadota bacterium]
MNTKLLVAFSAGGILMTGFGAWVASAKDMANPDQLLEEMAQKATSLAHQTTLLRDEKQIEKLQRIYGYYLDKKMWNQVADLFADNATFEPGQYGVYVGKAHIRHALDMLGPEGIKDGELFNHMQLQPVVHVAEDGNSAKARSREFSQIGVFGKSAFWAEGVYENEYVKQGGVWKIQKLHYYVSFVTPYAKGWGKEVLAARTVAPKGFEPDQPSTLLYQAYPKYFVPPFHYPNPVTGKPVQVGTAQTEGVK